MRTQQEMTERRANRTTTATVVLLAGWVASVSPNISEVDAHSDRANTWDRIVRSYAKGRRFRYRALRDNPDAKKTLGEFVSFIGSADPSSWSTEDQLAFYINAYNALVVHSVLELWPVKSVLREPGFFDERTHRIAGRKLTLDELEDDILRAKFDDARVHFAINCASMSCAPLAGHAYRGSRVESMLETQTRQFVRRTTELDRKAGRAVLSKLFEWYRKDFGSHSGIRDFVARYLDEEGAAFAQKERTDITYADYDWSLNDAE